MASHSVARDDIRNGSIFNPGAIGSSAGVWIGGGVTRTKPSPTLFMTSVPRGVDLELVRRSFAKEPGFVILRTVRRMVFVDFTDERSALAAMRAHQGEVFPGSSAGLCIDFDKDSRLKRDAQYEKQVRGDERLRQAAVTTTVHCRGCRAPVFFIVKSPTRLLSYPRRGTDGALVIDEAAHLKRIECTQGEQKVIRREKGLERQWPLLCPSCTAPIGYRPAPLGQETKYLYIISDAVSEDTDGAAESMVAGGMAAATCSSAAATEPTSSLAVGFKRGPQAAGICGTGALDGSGAVKVLRRDPAPVQVTAEALVSGLTCLPSGSR